MISAKALEKLRSLKVKKVYLQIPEGLKTRALSIAASLEEKGFTVVLGLEPCFGACDLRDREAKQLGCDALLHIGHSDFGLGTSVPVVYDEWFSDFDPVRVLKKNLKKLDKYDFIGLASSVQYADALKKARDFLESKNKHVLAGKQGRLLLGQVLGCDYSNVALIEDRADCFIFIGSGSFHYSGLAARTAKPTFFIDAETDSFTLVHENRDTLEIKRRLRTEKAKDMRTFGIFVSTKPGQSGMEVAGGIRKALEKKNKQAFIISADMLTKEKIMGMGIEVLVNTACPRIYEDQGMLGALVLNPEDVKDI
ncbi:MAG: diphthamide biosynthesis enzyme Dph2 [Candidatus Aenigmatarchaeota archaeon]|nr:MAG: diphthamide biosynthesis enzyme Dph2 [Candidatus Aenigmarchaeota archaeon]